MSEEHEVEYVRIRTQSDLDQLKYWLEDPELLKMARMTEASLKDEDFQEYLETYSFFIVLDGLAVGYIRLFKTEDPDRGEIGVVIALPEYREKGLGYTVGKRIVGTAMQMGIKTIDWATADYNLPSVRLAKKLGFRFYKLIPEIIVIGNEKHDALIYRFGE